MFKPRSLVTKKSPTQHPAKRQKVIQHGASTIQTPPSVREPVDAISHCPTPLTPAQTTQDAPQISENNLSTCVVEKTEETEEKVFDACEKSVETKSDNTVTAKESVENHEGNADSDDNTAVIANRSEQRFPLPDEPVCIVCGRYGEYICDQTDHDVCSLECKQIDIEQTQRSFVHPIRIVPLEPLRTPSSTTSTPLPPPLKTPATVNDSLLARLTGYAEHPDIASIPASQVDLIRASHHITVKGKSSPRPILSFDHCNLDPKLSENILQSGLKTPTPIQMQAIPAALSGRDLLATAETGSGKTAAFLIPIIAHISSLSQMFPTPLPSSSVTGPTALILAPTRELCMQIEQTAKSFMIGLPNMRTVLLVGGLPLPNQLHRLRQGVQLAIATPGRLVDILDHHPDAFDVSCLRILVLDEADAMLRMGFSEQLDRILSALSRDAPRQTYLLSATIPDSVDRLARRLLLRDPIAVTVGSLSAPTATVKQTVLWVENASKKKQLFSLINDPKYFRPPLVVFVDSKVGAELLATAVEKKCGVRAVAMHGDKEQEERSKVIREFSEGAHQVIVSTGVLARGLDLPGVTMVVNFDMAVTLDEYVHQIG
ncbi:hypothetical protein BC937DRAFT_88011, partial [Endogone sp. FLAS-F59071]